MGLELGHHCGVTPLGSVLVDSALTVLLEFGRGPHGRSRHKPVILVTQILSRAPKHALGVGIGRLRGQALGDREQICGGVSPLVNVGVDKGGLLKLVGGARGARELAMFLSMKVDLTANFLHRGSCGNDVVVNLTGIRRGVLQ